MGIIQVLPFTIAHYGGVNRARMRDAHRGQQTILYMQRRHYRYFGIVIKPNSQSTGSLGHNLARLLLFIVQEQGIGAADDFTQPSPMRFSDSFYAAAHEVTQNI